MQVKMYVEFLPFLPFEKTFEYSSEFDVAIGDVVRCRFGAFDTLGIIINTHATPQTKHKLSSIKEVVFKNVFCQKKIDFIKKIAEYYGYDIGLFAKLCFPFNIKECKFETQIEMVKLCDGAKFESSKAQKWKEIFNTLKNTDGIPSSFFTGISQFKNRGLLEFFFKESVFENKQKQKILDAQIPSLSFEQMEIYNKIKENFAKFAVDLIFGKTGSGKTEIYIHLIKSLIQQKPNAQILLMLPEIGLAKVICQRLESRFGIKIPVWNSAVADGIKKKQYQEIAFGACNIIIGTRSALFLPYKNLQMIIVDEEHDFSYKQEESPIYNARDCSVMHGKMFDIPIILGSATPSLESIYNAEIGKYQMHKLDARFNSVLMPKIEVVYEKSKKILCETAKKTILEYYKSGKQILVFLNRRGFAPMNECKACKQTFRCDSCDSFLTYHKKKGVLMCHKCAASYPIYNGCLMCGNELEVVCSGSGVEAVYEEVLEFLTESCDFKKSEIRIFSSDEQSTEKKLEEFIESVKKEEVKIIIGTQIASKGYDFPNLKLVCVIDLILKNDDIDFKADEKLMQLLVQVAGRSGRSGEQGLVLIQTKRSKDVVKKIMNSEEFYKNEIISRKQNFLPPFSRFIAVIFLGKNEKFVQMESIRIAKEIQEKTGVGVLGPAPAAIAFIRNVFRYRILIIASKKNIGIQRKIQEILRGTKCKTRLDVDVINFY